jgi:phosphoribosylformylglycinamidine (FGAM) synthase PurS component
MAERVVAIRLKIPDNEAFTALSALQRLGVPARRLERNEVWIFNDEGSETDFVRRVESNETLFNPNKHQLTVLEDAHPRGGEAWIEELGAHDDVRGHLGGKGIHGVTRARRYVGWRLFGDDNSPASPALVHDAVTRLLCNPAIERAIIG